MSPMGMGCRNCSPSTAAVITRVREWRLAHIAPAMSIRCMTVPPRMNPSGLASLGRTTWVMTETESAGVLGADDTERGYQVKETKGPRDQETKRPADGEPPQFGCLVPWSLKRIRS
jgi:hypothetical protein